MYKTHFLLSFGYYPGLFYCCLSYIRFGIRISNLAKIFYQQDRSRFHELEESSYTDEAYDVGPILSIAYLNKFN